MKIEPQTIKKVYAYIVQNQKLLVFYEPDFPDVGFQIPGGTVEEDSLEDALKREVFEETGLSDFDIKQYLGSNTGDMRHFGKNEFHERHFFYLILNEKTPETWEHIEKFPSESEHKEIRFSFFWHPIEEEIDLGSQSVFLEQVMNFV